MNIVRSIATAERNVLERAFEQRCKSIVLGDYTALTRVLGDLLLYVDTRDVILAPHLLMNGCWEFWVTQAIARHMKPGMVCADIGANVGYYTVLMAALVGDKGHVHSFDLLPESRRLLRRSAEINGFKQTVTVYEHGVSEADGDMGIRVPRSSDPRDAFGHLANTALTATAERMDPEYTPGLVPVRALDSLNFGERLDFVKMDVEGAEPLVWNGAKETFGRYNPVLCMEYEGWRSLATEHLAVMRQAGYRVRYVEYDSTLVELPAEPDPERLYMLWVTR
jgi:FkbM family methyltransferase